MDGFDHYTSVANGGIKWNTFNASLAIQTAVARNGNSLKADNANRNFAKTLDNQATWIIGFGYQLSALNQIRLIELIDAGTTQCALRVNTDGTLEVVRGTTTALNASGKSSFSLLTNTWYYIEWKVTIADSISANTCKVNVNGVNWINVDAAQDLKAGSNAFASNLSFNTNASTIMNIYYDDIYVLDGTGSVNNDILGDSRVETLFPNADGNYSQWDGSDGNQINNYLLVDETNQNGDTDYVETSTVNNIDTYNFGNLSSTPTSIAGIQINTTAEKTEAGARTFANLIRISSTDYLNSNNFSLSQNSYIDFLQIYEQDPSTSAAWGVTNINGAEYGYKLTA